MEAALFGVLAGLTFFSVGSTMFLGSKLRRLNAQLAAHKKDEDHRKTEIHVLSHQIFEGYARLTKLEQTLEAFEQELSLGKHEPSSAGASVYLSAIKLAKKGLDVEDLMDSCGISRGEGELIWQLHGTPCGSASAT